MGGGRKIFERMFLKDLESKLGTLDVVETGHIDP